MSTSIPQLERHCGSWVVTLPNGQVFELYDRANVEELAEMGCKVETAGQYLGRINAEIRSAEHMKGAE